jgi:signal recognition particle GTPase
VKPSLTLEDVHQRMKQLRRKEQDVFQGFAGTDTDFLMLGRAEKILEAMSEDERKNVDLLLDRAVRERIAIASGTQINDVDELISPVAQVGRLMHKFRSKGQP